MMHLNQSQGRQEAPSASGEQAMRTETRLRGRTLVIVRVLWGLIVGVCPQLEQKVGIGPEPKVEYQRVLLAC